MRVSRESQNAAMFVIVCHSVAPKHQNIVILILFQILLAAVIVNLLEFLSLSLL